LYISAVSDTFRIYSVHLKANNTASDRTARAAEIDSLRQVTNSLPPGKYFIVLGDFNIYGSTEAAYQKLLQVNQTDDGHFVDPWTLTGTWNNSLYAAYHTQSTRTRQLPDSGATGGLDDRFDMILHSRSTGQPGKIQYVAGSLTAIGNDANHYNDSINQQPNTAVPESVANALHYASDHLPVCARFVLALGAVVGQYAVSDGWNLVSVPLTVIDYRKTAVFPSSISSAFAFDQTGGYVSRDTLRNGTGYWLKFPATQTVGVTGMVRLRDTLYVSTGWNLIGSISNPAIADSIIQMPSGIVGSQYYGYSGAYSVADTLFPAKGYWVKINQNGQLILR
jgi:hypothetical protein